VFQETGSECRARGFVSLHKLAKKQKNKKDGFVSHSTRIRLPAVDSNFADKYVTGKVGADALVTRSTMKAMCLCAHSGSESWNNPAEVEK
jgi:hypothetical protein